MNISKKIFMGLLMFGMAASLWAQGPYRSAPPKKPWKPANETRGPVSALPAVMRAADEVPVMTVIDEDFSNLTAGTEDAPDATEIGASGPTGYDIAEGYMKEGRWTGMGVHQAGGACALMTYYNEYYQEDTFGFISTPEMALYGECVVTFRARRLPSSANEGNLWLALCDNYEGPMEDETFVLTDEWQQYEFRCTKATFSDISIFQFTAKDGEILLDDIKVTRKRNRIPAPTANSPVNVSPTEFIANWNPTATAERYLLNVYYKAMPDGEPVKGTVTESFDDINLDASGRIDAANPNYPEGWTIALSANGTVDVTTDKGWFGSGRQGLCFDAVGDVIVSPDMPAPLSRLSFWVRPSKVDYYEDIMSLLGVLVKHRDGTWEHIANLPCYWMDEQGGPYEFDTEDMGDDVLAVRLSMEQKGEIVFYVDDITLDYATQPVPYTVIDEELTDTFRVVSGINPDADYYYTVRAKEGPVVSDATYPVWVDGIEGVTPTALSPENVSSTGFTARWEPLRNAQRYNVNLYEAITTTEPGQEITLLTENFDKVQGGTVDNPLSPSGYNHIYDLVAEGLTHTDWKGIYPVWADGMVGGRAGAEWSRGGMIVTPPLPLGDGGDVTVSFTAYNDKPGDKLAVVLMDDVNAVQGIVGYEVPFSATDKGTITESVTITTDIIGQYVPSGKDYYVAFMTTTSGAFFLDEVEVRQVRNGAGEKILAPRDFVQPETCGYDFSGLNPGGTYAYDVTAYCYKDFVTYLSEPSEPMEVCLLTTGICPPYVAAGNDGQAEYFSLTGQKLNAASLPKGVIVVKDAKGSRKIVNR